MMSSKKARADQPHAPPLAAPGHALTSTGQIPDLLTALAELRLVRDKKLYLRDGFHTFRHWTMSTFGEKLGAWIEETI